jgi:hypothetical protein
MSEPTLAVSVDGVTFDLDKAPADLQRKWTVTQAALEIAKGTDRAALREQLTAIGKEIAAAMAVTELIKRAPRAHGAAGLWAKLHRL